MTRAATVVRRNDDLAGPTARSATWNRGPRSALSDTGNWTNQNLVFTRAFLDMFPLAKTSSKGPGAGRMPGAHYKPEFEMPHLNATDPAERLRQAEAGAIASTRTTGNGSRRPSPRLAPDGEPT